MLLLCSADKNNNYYFNNHNILLNVLAVNLLEEVVKEIFFKRFSYYMHIS